MEVKELVLGGRYCKLSREVSHTPFFVDGGVRRGVSSVQEEIVNAFKYVCGDAAANVESVFFSAGREDVDVRMLGRGRPFVLVLSGVPSSLDPCLSSVQERLAHENLVSVQELRNVGNDYVIKVKEAGEEKKKTYRAVVVLGQTVDGDLLRKVNELAPLQVTQKTPIRVMHRRSLAARERVIFGMSCVELNQRALLVDLTTQAGMYIKEFVHGDCGRTVPSLKSLLQQGSADIIQLDVVNIECDGL